VIQRHVQTFLATTSAALLASAIGTGAHAQTDDPNAWPMYSRGYDNTRYSPLKQIDTGNVANLKLAYSFQLGSLRSNESSPIVDRRHHVRQHLMGTEVRLRARRQAPALESGPTSPKSPTDTLQYACCDVNSRGVTYDKGKIFVGRLGRQALGGGCR
jgi:hypothetical protein